VNDNPTQQPSDQTVTSVNTSSPKPAKCFKCDELIIGFCRHCGQDFCEKHRSKQDSRFCSECIGENTLQIQESPLTDDEGVTHQGRQLKLIGEGWPASMEMIRTLSDVELEYKIAEWKKLLAEAIKTSEYFRITVCAAEFEKEDRFRSKVRKLQKRREELQQGVINLNNKKMRAKAQKDPAEAIAAQLGVTVEVARLLMRQLGKSQ